MNPCIKTGADVWDSACSCLIHCDAYFVPAFPTERSTGVYIFRYTEGSNTYPSKEEKIKSLIARAHFVINNEELWRQQYCFDMTSAQCLVIPGTLVKSRINLTTGAFLNV